MERQAREGSLAWAAFVRSALADEDLNAPEASLRLGYDLGGHHVALVLSHYQSGDHTSLDSAAFDLARAVSRLKPLVVRVDIDTTWCWIPVQGAINVPALRAAVLVGQGRPGSGLSGFRRSHREALNALRVARLARVPAGSVTRFDQIELAALCSNDPAYCRAFIADRLGRLAAQTEEIQKLRATLEAYFKANCNYRGAAAQLGLHHNTVRYRLDRAADLLGRSPDEDRLQLELALHLASRLGLGNDGERSEKKSPGAT
jgi:DNA-binding PucR family transcriptional regulator